MGVKHTGLCQVALEVLSALCSRSAVALVSVDGDVCANPSASFIPVSHPWRIFASHAAKRTLLIINSKSGNLATVHINDFSDKCYFHMFFICF